MTGCIYCISNTVNDKLYIGKTLLSLDKRFKEHCHDSKSRTKEQRPLYRAMNKYGIGKFSISHLEEVDCEFLDIRETYWIEKLETYRFGYNATKGGDGKILYDEDKFTKDFQNGLSLREISRQYSCDVATIRKRLKAQGLNPSTNGHKYHEEPVSQYDISGNYIQSFCSCSEAARNLISQGLSTQKVKDLVTNISRVTRGIRKTCCGFIWKSENC